MRAKFTGHDTFPLRYGWLYKAVNHLNSGGKLQTSKEDETQQAIIQLGVGKNMVNAIRYWAECAGLLESKRKQSNIDYYTSENGDYLFNETTGKDPYLEHLGSIWLVHFWLCFNEDEMTSYRYFFNIFNGEYFEKQVLLAHMSNDLVKLTSGDSSLNDSTIQKDIDTFLNSYSKKHITKTGDEEQFNSPLTELSLIQESGKNYYLSDLNSKSDLPIEIFIYALLKFIQKESRISKVSKVNFKSLLLDPLSPGRIFRLSEQGLGEKLDSAQDYSNGSISWLDTSGLRQVSVDSEYLNQEQVVLDSYYEGANNV
ncbi:DUF4007 family protein [Pseudoalteromonas sp. L21]|uniref:DUF4007 family protein n=1 Tax=Pseudoalteromonas sp. L21 TaxID=1539746 RepID=UPI001F417E90|nr:DUF4007 family protein [Pseudoalteromonas sp. L21]MCF7519386.1 DUF4007 family protein [Pseudoalteromonas sp. L21]